MVVTPDNGTLILAESYGKKLTAFDIAEFALGRTRELPFVDGSRFGVAGFDLGGISALLLARRNPEV